MLTIRAFYLVGLLSEIALLDENLQPQCMDNTRGVNPKKNMGIKDRMYGRPERGQAT